DEEALRQAGIKTDTPLLIDLFRKRTLDPSGQNRVAALVGQLGDPSFSIREKAAQSLMGLGPIAVPFLRQPSRSRDLEVARRAEECLQRIDGSTQIGLVGAAARLLAVRKAPGTVEALLAFLPFARSEADVADVQSALAALAACDEPAEHALLDL